MNVNSNYKKGSFYNSFNLNDMIEDEHEDPSLTFEDEFCGHS